MDRDGLVTLWTFQSWEDWRTLRNTGRLRREEAHVAHIEPVWRVAYEWMREAMWKRVPGYGGAWPLWAWASAPQSFLYAIYGWPLGMPFVRLTLRVDLRRVLCSDFDAWHCVLNRSPLCLTESEDAVWDARPGRYDRMGPEFQEEIRATWPRIFDFHALAQSPLWDANAGDRDAQAVLEEIRREDVVRVIPCIGRQWPPRIFRHTKHTQ